MPIHPLSVVCENKRERKMSDRFQTDGNDQLANGPSSRDFRIESEVNGSQAQLDVHASEPSTVAPEEFPAPIAKFLGLKLLQAKNGRAEVEFVADERHANPAGTLHGGVFCDIADAAMGLAYYTTLEADESMTTLELKINFLRPVRKATLRARAKVVRAGRLIGLVECDVVDEQERLVARASSTCLTLRGQLAEGRRISPLATRASTVTLHDRRSVVTEKPIGQA
jgi:uncharacterized protein (TIGR00369 family)